MPDSASLASKMIERMGSQVDKLVDNISGVNAKLATLDAHMQNFSINFAAVNERLTKVEAKSDRYDLMWNNAYGEDGKSGYVEQIRKISEEIKKVAEGVGTNENRVPEYIKLKDITIPAIQSELETLRLNKRDALTLWKSACAILAAIAFFAGLALTIKELWPQATPTGKAILDKVDGIEQQLGAKPLISVPVP